MLSSAPNDHSTDRPEAPQDPGPERTTPRGQAADSHDLAPEFAAAFSALSGGDATLVGAEEYAELGRALEEFEPELTIPAIAGLLTVPEYQTATIRIEVLLHLAVLHCRGRRRPRITDVARWLQITLANLPVRRLEDPLEDVHLSNVVAPGGNYRIFEGTWESNDYHLQDVIDCVFRSRSSAAFSPLARPIAALLRLSDAVATRGRLTRWTISDRVTPRDVFLSPMPSLPAMAARVSFGMQDLEDIGISPSRIVPFCLPMASRDLLRRETLGFTSLERYPLIPFETGLILACPTAVGAAVRRYVLEWMRDNNKMDAFRQCLRIRQGQRLYGAALGHVDAPGTAFPDLPKLEAEEKTSPPAWDEVVCAIDTNKLAHVVLLHDDPQTVLDTGLGSFAKLADETSTDFAEHLRETAHRLKERATAGLTVVVYGGLGRGIALGLPRFPEHWQPVVISLPDFVTFAWSPGASLLRLWKMYEQMDRLYKGGVEAHESNGTLNTYAFWVAQEYNFCPHEFPFPPHAHGFIQPGTDFIRDFRIRERQLNDVHAAEVRSEGTSTLVRRFHRDSFFPAMNHRPIYASDELVQVGDLLGVVETPHVLVWVWASRPERAPEAASFTYQLWDGLLIWIDRLVPILTASVKVSGTVIMHLHLELANESEWQKIGQPGQLEATPPLVVIEANQNDATITIPFGFVSLLRRPTNDGERVLLEVACQALLEMLARDGHCIRGVSGEFTPDRAGEIARDLTARCMGGTDARSLHMFEANRPTDYLSTRDSRHPRLLQPEDRAWWTIGLAWGAVDQQTLVPTRRRTAATGDELEIGSSTRPLTGAEAGNADSGDPKSRVRELLGAKECRGVLNDLVDHLWGGIHHGLHGINGPSLVRLALENLEAVSQDRQQWSRTARAVMALHGSTSDAPRIAAEREGERGYIGTCTRVLVEMAVSSCDVQEGRQAAAADYDWLVAGVGELIELASDSDAIHGGLAEPRIRVYPNGAVQCDREFIRAVVTPYGMESSVEGFHDAAAAYEELFEPRRDRELQFDASFVHAFAAEYGLTPLRAIDAFAELLDLGVEGEHVVYESTRETVGKSLQQRRQFTDLEVQAFFRVFSLTPRPPWDRTPIGFLARDWWPWRFRRRLSLSARPVVVFGEHQAAPLFYGMHQLGASLSYMFENVQSAWLPDEYFRSAEMKRYRGMIADTLGHAFNEEVAAAVRGLGWEARAEVEMSSLGAPAELGDIDVVAWRSDDPRLVLVECKRLQPARTIGEIVDLLLEFRGATGDRLDRHLRRTQWVRENAHAVRTTLGIPARCNDVMALLIANRDVPMSYAQGLALPADQIRSLNSLNDWLSTSATKSRGPR